MSLESEALSPEILAVLSIQSQKSIQVEVSSVKGMTYRHTTGCKIKFHKEKIQNEDLD